MSIIRRIKAKLTQKTECISHYLLETDNPLIQYFYFLIGPIAYTAFLLNIYIGRFSLIGPLNFFIGNTLTLLGFYNYYKAWKTDAGKITKKTVSIYKKKYENFYDGESFKKNNNCKTCKFEKPARSKHCKICKNCISRFDHHCPWIRNCVGEKNMHFFTRFIFYHFLFCFFKFCLSSYLIAIEFYVIVRDLGLVDLEDSQVYQYVWVKLLTGNKTLVILCFWTAFTSSALFLFFLAIVTKYVRNLTMNEEFKMEEVREKFERELEIFGLSLISGKVRDGDLELFRERTGFILEWFCCYESNYFDTSYVGNFFKLIFF